MPSKSEAETMTPWTRMGRYKRGKFLNFPMEVPMNTRVRLFLHGLLLILGLSLIIGGLAVTKHGAVVIGIIVAGVSVQRFFRTNRATKDERMGHAP